MARKLPAMNRFASGAPSDSLVSVNGVLFSMMRGFDGALLALVW